MQKLVANQTGEMSGIWWDSLSLWLSTHVLLLKDAWEGSELVFASSLFHRGDVWGREVMWSVEVEQHLICCYWSSSRGTRHCDQTPGCSTKIKGAYFSFHLLVTWPFWGSSGGSKPRQVGRRQGEALGFQGLAQVPGCASAGTLVWEKGIFCRAWIVPG